MAKCYACKNYQSGYCKLTGTHSYTGDICNEFVNKEQSKMFDDCKQELRATKHVLWMVRAYNGFNTTYNLTSYHNYMIEHPNTKVTPRRWYHCWKTVERKCLEKAKEFK